MNKFERINEAKKAYQEAVRSVGKDDFWDLFKPLFEKYPFVVAVKWKQFTPYFNDGDVCRFSVREMFFKLQDTAEDAGDYEDGFDYSYGLKGEQKQAADAFEDVIGVDEETMEMVFGEHSEVTVDKDGITVEDYSDHH